MIHNLQVITGKRAIERDQLGDALAPERRVAPQEAIALSRARTRIATRTGDLRAAVLGLERTLFKERRRVG